MEAFTKNPQNRRWAMIAGGALAATAALYYFKNNDAPTSSGAHRVVGSKNNATGDQPKTGASSTGVRG